MTEREKLLAEIDAALMDAESRFPYASVALAAISIARDRIAALPFFAPESAPAAGESGEEKPERPPMLLAATVRPFAPITDWAWYARSGDEWMMILSDVYTCESDVFVGVDRTLSDPAALALYDAEAAPAPEREKEPHGD
jgi:hypothetical protein